MNVAVNVACGTVDITPIEPFTLGGYKSRTTEDSTWFSSPLEANFVIERRDGSLKILLVMDTLFIGRKLYQGIERQLNKHYQDRNQISLFAIASHTHNAPMVDARKPELGACDEHYMEMVTDKIAAAIIKFENQQMSVVGTRYRYTSECHASVYRRSRRLVFRPRYPWASVSLEMQPDRTKKIDKTLSLFLLLDEAGRNLAVFWSWPCHPTTIGNRDILSADYPGVVREHIRKRFKSENLPVLYLPGFCGDIRPGIFAKKTVKDILHMPTGTIFKRPGKAEYKLFCEQICKAVDTAFDGRAYLAPVCDSFRDAHSEILPLECVMDGDVNELSLEMQMMSIASMRILCVNAEVCSPYFDLMQDLPFDLFTGCANDTFGYLPADCQIANGGYEVNGFTHGFGLDGCYHNRIERKVLQVATEGVKVWLGATESADV